MKTISPEMDTHLSGVVTTLCSCWKITRTDGEVLGFTDHDVSLTIDGIEFKAATGYYRSAISNSADSGVDNLDVSGFLDDASLDETELRNGAYDYAEVEVFAVNWADLSQGIIKLRYGLFGEVMIVSSGFFKVELRGLTQLFSQTIGETYSPECRADLGDENCKVPLVPPVRRSVHSYQTGDRIIVPIPPGVSVDLPLKNPGFELREIGHPWTELSGNVVNTNFFGQDIVDPFAEQDVYRLLIKTATGSVTFRRNKSLMGYDSIPDFQAEATVLSGGEGVQFRLTAFWGDQNSVFDPETSLGGAFEVTTGWVTLSALGEALLALPTALPEANTAPDAEFVRYTIEWQDAVPDLVYFVGYPMVDSTVIHKSLLAPVGSPTTSGYDWILSPSARYTGPTVWISPSEGAWNLELYPGPGDTEYAYQVLDLADLSDYFDEIDDGTMVIKLSSASGASTIGVQNFVSFVFYNEVDAVIGTDEQEPQNMYGKGFWGPFEYATAVPPLTRKVRVQVNTKNPTVNARSRGVWDSVSTRMYQESYENQGNYLSYGGVEFLCTSPGISSVAPPVYSYTLGVVTADGGAQFTAVEPLHMFTTEITEVISNKQFKITSNIDKENSWFEWGVLEMLSGPNLHKKIEIASWDNSTKTITLALSLPYIPQVGDDLRMHTGCAKSRAVCTSKFNNMVNYRGEPDLPGTDQYFKIGAANSGESAPPGKGGK